MTNTPACYAASSSYTITQSQWQKIKNDKAFGYKNDKELIKKPKPYNPSPLIKFFEAFFLFFGKGFGLFLLWAGVISLVLFIVYKLVFSKNSILFSKHKKMTPDDNAPVDEENILTTDWEGLLQKAISNNDLRHAVRYSYMWLLQMLQQKELIKYSSDKTNYEYYIELSSTEHKKPFKQLSRQYEFAWYSQFGVPKELFNEYLTEFNHFKSQLSR